MNDCQKCKNPISNCDCPPSALDVQPGGSHYKDMKIQPVEFIHANGIPFLEANVIKYVCRHKSKNGLQDLEKARHYIDLLIELEYSKEEEPEKETKPDPFDNVGKGYRRVKGTETIKEGDEYFDRECGVWKTTHSSGVCVDSPALQGRSYRRPIPK